MVGRLEVEHAEVGHDPAELVEPGGGGAERRGPVLADAGHHVDLLDEHLGLWFGTQ